MEKQKLRSEIDDKYKWDLEAFMKESDIEANIKEIKELTDKVVSYQNKIMESAKTLLEFEKIYTDLDRKLSNLIIPTRKGYKFVGWFDSLTGGNQITSITKFTQNTTIYARWIKEQKNNDSNIVTLIIAISSAICITGIVITIVVMINNKKRKNKKRRIILPPR